MGKMLIFKICLIMLVSIRPFFDYAISLVGSLFPDQGSNMGPRSGRVES